MVAVSTIATAVALAEKTGLTSWLGGLIGGDKGEQVADKVVSVAKVVTGAKTPNQALEAISKNKTLADELSKQLLNQEHELTKLAFADLADARDTYERTDHKVADELARLVMAQNIWFVVLLIGVNVAVVMLIENVGIVATISSLIGAAVNHFLSERLKVLSFHFGSSYGSKGKGDQQSAMMSRLTALVSQRG